MSAMSRRRYLFIRVLEACNADCFMCGFALSRDSFRFSTDEMTALMAEACEVGVGFVRFTGGEPLMHRSIGDLIAIAREFGMKTSLITNGMQLKKKLPILVDAGLKQIVVSLDGASSESHDEFRGSPGCFVRATDGLAAAIDAGILGRVNSVVGPHNYREMPDLQTLLVDLCVAHWELSALKRWSLGIPQPIIYDDPDDVRRVGEWIYGADVPLRPMGKRWYGETPEEQRLYFEESIPPRASAPLCHVTNDVIYVDARNGQMHSCSCTPHLKDGRAFSVGFRTADGRFDFRSDARAEQQRYFRQNGPEICIGCSATAAGYSDLVATGVDPPDWAY